MARDREVTLKLSVKAGDASGLQGMLAGIQREAAAAQKALGAMTGSAPRGGPTAGGAAGGVRAVGPAGAPDGTLARLFGPAVASVLGTLGTRQEALATGIKPQTQRGPMLGQAQDNLRLLAEAQVRKTATGDVGLQDLEKSAKAVEILSKGMDGTAKKTKDAGTEAKNLGKALQDVTRGATIGFAALSATIMSTVSAGAPAAYDTLTQSLSLLSAQIGQALMPVVLQAADYIQDLADWFGNLDEATKEQIGSIAKWAAISLGAVMVAGQLATAIKLVVAAGMGIYTLLGPWGLLAAAVGAVVGVVLKLSGAFNAAGQSIERMAASAGTLAGIKEKLAGGGSLSKSDVQETLTGEEERRLREAKTPEERKKIAGEMLRKESPPLELPGGPQDVPRFQEEQRRRREQFPDEEEREKRAAGLRADLEKAREQVMRPIPGLSGAFSSEEAHRERRAREQVGPILEKHFPNQQGPGPIADAIKEALEKGDQNKINQIIEAQKQPGERHEAREQVLQQIEKTGTLPGQKDHKRALPRETAPAYSGFAAAREKFQLDLLKKSPIELEIVALQRKAYQAMTQHLPSIDKNTEGIKDIKPGASN